MEIVLAHGDVVPPPLTVSRIFTTWALDPWILVPVLLAAAIYLLGVRRLTARGVAWPVSRTVLWFVGLGVIVVATSSSVGVYDTAMFSMHSVQHMFIGLMVAQSAMGTSWRIGVDPEERTALVSRGVFALVRNPVFTMMIVAMIGLTLLVPVWLQVVVALASLVVGVQIQVRAVEEPCLLSAHGAAYRRYAAHTGRFVPMVGRLARVVPRIGDSIQGR